VIQNWSGGRDCRNANIPRVIEGVGILDLSRVPEWKPTLRHWFVGMIRMTGGIEATEYHHVWVVLPLAEVAYALDAECHSVTVYA